MTTETLTKTTKADFCGVGKDLFTRNVEEALEKAEMNFTCSKHQNLIIGKDVLANLLDENTVHLSSPSPYNGLYFSRECPIVRDDTHEVLCNMGKDYKIIQNSECVAILESILKKQREMHIVRGGIIKNCERLFLTCQLRSPIFIGQDEIKRFVNIQWSHTGKSSIKIRFIPFLTRGGIFLNFRGKTQHEFDIRHTKNADKRLDEATKILASADAYFGEVQEIFENFVNTPFSVKAMDKFLNILYHDPKETLTKKGAIRTPKNEGVRERIEEIWKSTPETIGFNKWAAFTSVCEYVDKEGATRVCKGASAGEVRLENLWFGTGNTVKMDAFKILSDMKGN